MTPECGKDVIIQVNSKNDTLIASVQCKNGKCEAVLPAGSSAKNYDD